MSVAKNEEKRRPRRATTATMLVVLLVVLEAWPAAAVATPDKQPLNDFGTSAPIVGTFSQLKRGDDAVSTRIRASATPGHAITFWYVIFNNTHACLGDACGAEDIFVGGDPANGPNFDQIQAARISIVYGGAGGVVNPGGRLALNGGLAVGEVPTGTVPVVIGDPADGALIPGPVTGLEDAQAAEIHIVLQDHGQAHDDADLLAEQLTGFETACNPTCADIQFAVHQ